MGLLGPPTKTFGPNGARDPGGKTTPLTVTVLPLSKEKRLSIGEAAAPMMAHAAAKERNGVSILVNFYEETMERYQA